MLPKGQGDGVGRLRRGIDAGQSPFTESHDYRLLSRQAWESLFAQAVAKKGYHLINDSLDLAAVGTASR